MPQLNVDDLQPKFLVGDRVRVLTVSDDDRHPPHGYTAVIEGIETDYKNQIVLRYQESRWCFNEKELELVKPVKK